MGCQLWVPLPGLATHALGFTQHAAQLRNQRATPSGAAAPFAGRRLPRPVGLRPFLQSERQMADMGFFPNMEKNPQPTGCHQVALNGSEYSEVPSRPSFLLSFCFILASVTLSKLYRLLSFRSVN